MIVAVVVLTTQGVREWPSRTFRHRPVRQQVILTVWSPLRQTMR